MSMYAHRAAAVTGMWEHPSKPRLRQFTWTVIEMSSYDMIHLRYDVQLCDIFNLALYECHTPISDCFIRHHSDSRHHLAPADGNLAVCSKLWFQLPNTILPSNLMWHVCHGYDNILLWNPTRFILIPVSKVNSLSSKQLDRRLNPFDKAFFSLLGKHSGRIQNCFYTVKTKNLHIQFVVHKLFITGS